MKQRFIADIHIHTKYSRATSKKANPYTYALWAKLKGIKLLGTGDITHPEYLKFLKENLKEEETGLYSLKKEFSQEIVPGYSPEVNGIRFILTGEISTVYSEGGKVRKIHHVVVLSSLEKAEKFSLELQKYGNVSSDGRPILGITSRTLLDILLSVDEDAYLIPAHIWTPWFSLLGSNSGYDSLEEAYKDLSKYIFAVETGLSSDPTMNWYVPFLDNLTLVSNSDAHSPKNLGREANLFYTELDYFSIKNALKTKEGFLGTIEFFPEEGKYHYDGHRKCGIVLSPFEAIKKYNNICPVCHKPLTLGVYHRVLELGELDRNIDKIKKERLPFFYIVPLPEILSELLNTQPQTKKVEKKLAELINYYGNEFDILLNININELKHTDIPLFDEAIKRLREGKVYKSPGFDGEYGKIKIFSDEERKKLLGEQKLFKVNIEFNKTTIDEKKKEELELFSQLKKGKTKEEKKEKEKSTKNITQEELLKIDYPFIIVEAGPGTGKTYTLVKKVEKFLTENPQNSSKTAVITFTQKAAEELKERLKSIKSEIFISTFHTLGKYVLSLKNENIKIISKAKEKEILKLLGVKNPSSILEKLEYAINTFKIDEDIKEIGEKYYKYKRENKLYSIEDLIYEAIKLLKEDEDLRDTFNYFFIDEFQDINALQYKFIKSFNIKSLFVIGDKKQNIYEFRGSNYRFFDILEKEFNAKKFYLTINYRSDEDIVNLSNKFLNVEPPLTATKIYNDKSISIFEASNSNEEAYFIINKIEELIGGMGFYNVNFLSLDKENISFKDIAIIVRHRNVITKIVEYLKKRGIPYTIVGVKAPWSEDDFVMLVEKLIENKKDDWKEYLFDKFKEKTNDSVYLEKFESILKTYSSIEELYDYIIFNPYIEIDREYESVKILTIHASKGLEFDSVFIPSFDKENYPSKIFNNNIDEEKRLFYVAITRAKRNLFFSYNKHVGESPFIEGIKNLISKEKIKKKKDADQLKFF